MAGLGVKDEHVETGMQNLRRLVESVPTTILGHHILRDEKWRSLSQQIFDAVTEAGHKVLTAAEYLGKENIFLEFRRRQLFEREPVSSDFKKWMKMPLLKRKLIKSPI